MQSWHLKQPCAPVPARLKFHMHENSSPLLSDPTQFSFILYTNRDINVHISRIDHFWIHCGHVAFGKRYHIRTSSLTRVRGGAPYPSGFSFHSYAQRPFWRWFWCMRSPWCSRDRPRHSCSSFAGDASPSVGLLALVSRIPDLQYNNFFAETLAYKSLVVPRSTFR